MVARKIVNGRTCTRPELEVAGVVGGSVTNRRRQTISQSEYYTKLYNKQINVDHKTLGIVLADLEADCHRR